MRGARWHSAALLLGVLSSAAVGCSKKAPPPLPSAVVAAEKPKLPRAVLIGSVRLEPGRELPAYTPEQMERRVLMYVQGGTFPDICTPPKVADRMPVRQTADGKLIGVMLAASEFSHQPTAPPHQVHELFIKDCRLTPNIVVTGIGDTLHIKNEVKFPFLPGLSSDSFNQTLAAEQSLDIALPTPGVRTLSCGFTAPCGRTDVITLAHPYYAITAENGEFRIEDFPADETVRINAWHPLFSEAFVNVRVAHGETKRVELVLTPAPPPAPPAPAPPPSAADGNGKGKGKGKNKLPKEIIPD